MVCCVVIICVVSGEWFHLSRFISLHEICSYHQTSNRKRHLHVCPRSRPGVLQKLAGKWCFYLNFSLLLRPCNPSGQSSLCLDHLEYLTSRAIFMEFKKILRSQKTREIGHEMLPLDLQKSVPNAEAALSHWTSNIWHLRKIPVTISQLRKRLGCQQKQWPQVVAMVQITVLRCSRLLATCCEESCLKKHISCLAIRLYQSVLIHKLD